MPPEDSGQQQPDNPFDPKSEPARTGSFGFLSGEPLSEIFGLDPAFPATDPLLNAEIGGVKIVRLIAQGGMGRVYEGIQQKPSRTVAVKVMRPGLATPGMMKRFEHEAEILARLQHPGIAQIFAAGVHYVAGAPVPYFIMEYVADAKPLTTYADDLKLPIRARLDLFRSACDAVAHGHEQGVIHRDLKPSNILVDATGKAKVIDFGVAKATDSDVAVTTLQGDLGQIIGTLQYMSPEQAQADARNIDVRSDVYALGIILYELLAGSMPYDLRQKAIHEAVRIIGEAEPRPLSSVNRAIRRDLSLIASKCLSKEKRLRYSSASALSEDLTRYRDGARISATKPSLIDTLVRLARRHRTMAAAVSAIAFILFAAITGVSFYLNKARVSSLESKDQHYRRLVAMTSEALAQGRVADATTLFADAETAIGETGRKAARKPFELSLLRPFLDESCLILKPGGGAVKHVAVSPDGMWIATVSQQLHLWDSGTGRPTSALATDGSRVTDLIFAPNGEFLATAMTDGTVHIWQTSTRREVATLRASTAPVTAIAYSPDGMRLAAASADKVVIWETLLFTQTATLTGHRSEILCLVFSHDSLQILTGGNDRTARLWSVADGKEEATLVADNGSLSNVVRSVAFSPDGQLAAVGTNTVNVWELQQREMIATLPIEAWAKQAYGERIVSVLFCHDGATLAVAKTHGVTLWRPREGRILKDLKRHTAEILDAAVSPDGQRLATASGDHTCCLWSTVSGELQGVLPGHEGAVVSVVWTADSSGLLTGSVDGTSRSWYVPDDKPLNCLRLASPEPESKQSLLPTRGLSSPKLLDFAYSPGGDHLAAVTGAGLIIWDTHSFQVVSHVTDDGTCVRYSPSGKSLATCGLDCKIRLYAAHTGKLTGVLPSRKGSVSQLAYSPDGSRLAAVCGDKTVTLWDVTAGTALAHAEASFLLLFGCPYAFDPISSQLVVGSKEHLLTVFDATSGRATGSHEIPGRPIIGISFSRDGSRLLTHQAEFKAPLATFEARLWDFRSMLAIGDFHCTERRTAPSREHPDVTHSTLAKLLFSDDSLGVVTVTENIRFSAFSGDAMRSSAVEVWDAKTGQRTAQLKGSFAGGVVAAISPDCTRVAIASADRSVGLWELRTGEQLMSVKAAVAEITELRFSPDGHQLLVVGDRAQVLGLTNGEVVRSRIASTDQSRSATPYQDQSATNAALKVAADAMLPANKAKALAQSHDFLSLKGVTTLSEESAQELARHQGTALYLDSLTEISVEVAKALAMHRGGILSLDGLSTMSDAAAKELAGYQGVMLSLKGLKTLSEEAASKLRARDLIDLPRQFQK